MRVNDRLIGILSMVLGLVIIIRVQFYPSQPGGQPGPALFPEVIGGLLMIVGMVLFWQARRSTGPLIARPPELTAKGAGNILFTAGAVVFYILVSQSLGFLLTSFIIMVAMMSLLKAKLTLSVPVAAGTTVCIYMIFNKMLLVPLPRGFLYF